MEFGKRRLAIACAVIRTVPFLLLLVSTALFTPISVNADAPAPLTRAQLLEKFQMVSWRFLQIIRATAPELLWHRYQETQFALAPFSRCMQGPLADVKTPKKDMYEGLEEVQAALVSNLSDPKSALFQQGSDRKLPSDPVSFEVETKPLASGEFRCLPGEDFAPPASWGSDPGKVRLNKEREDKFKQLLETAMKVGRPFSVTLGKILPGHAVSNVELTMWMTWVTYLRQIYTDYLALQSSEPANLPPLEMSSSLGKRIAAFQKMQGFLNAGNAYGLPLSKGRLKVTEVAEKILTATSNTDRTPRFAPCVPGKADGKWCFVDPVLPPEEALNSRVQLKLHSPHLNYGSYLDSFVALAKQSQIQELTLINLLLPESLKLKDLPKACFVGKDATATAELEGLRGLFQSYGRLKKREWLVQNMAESAQRMALNIQHRKLPVIFPAGLPQTFEHGGQKTNFLKLLDSLALQWFERVVEIYGPKIRVRFGTPQEWETIKTNITEKLKRIPFESYLRFQEGLSSQNDFNSVLAEKITLLFASIAPSLSDTKELDVFSPDQIFYLTETLLLQATQAALLESGFTFLSTIMENEDFSGDEVDLLKNGNLKFLSLWEDEFAPRWREAIEKHGVTESSDLRQLAKSLATSLKDTSPYKNLVDGTIKFDAEESSKKLVDKRLNQGRPLWEQAARAEKTIQYLDSTLKTKEGFVNNFLPGGWWSPWNYSYMEDLAPKGSGPACFFIDGNEGVNPFGTLNPNTPDDWEHFKKVLSAIAHRKKDALIERLKNAVDEKTVKEKYGFPSYDAFARRLLKRWDILLEARPGLDSVHVTELREGALAPLVKSLNQTRTASLSYRAFTKLFAERIYKGDLAPLLRSSGKFDKGDRAYVEKFIRDVVQPQILLPGKEKLSLEMIEKAWAQSGEADRVKVQSKYEEIRSSLAQIQAKKIYATAAMKVSAEAVPFLELVKTDPSFVKERNDFLRKWLESEEAKTLFEARVAFFLNEDSLRASGNGVVFSDAVAELSKRLDKQATLIQSTLFTSSLPGEAALHWAGVPSDVRWETPLLGFLFRNKNVEPKPENFELVEKQKAIVLAKQAQRKDIAKASMKTLVEMLNEAAKLPKVDGDTTAQFFHQYVRNHPELYETFRAGVLDLLNFVEENLTAKNDEMLQVVFSAFKTAHKSFERSFAEPNILAETRRGLGQTVESYLADSMFAPFDEVKVTLMEQIRKAVAVRVQPVDAIIKLEETIEKLSDEVALAEQQDKKAELKRANEMLARSERRMSEYTDGVKQLGKMRTLLVYVAPAFPAAKAALAVMGEVKDDTTKLAPLYARFATEQNLTGIGKVRLSAKDIVTDLNEVSAAAVDYFEINPQIAQTFLEDIQAYAAAAKLESNLPLVEEWYQKTIEKAAAEIKVGGLGRENSMRRLIALRQRLTKQAPAADANDWADLAKYPKATVLLDEFSARAAALQDELKTRVQNSASEKKLLSSNDLRKTPFEEQYWTLALEVSDLIFSPTSSFSALTSSSKKATTTEDKPQPFVNTPYEGVFFRQPPVDLSAVRSPEYTPHPSMVNAALTSILSNPAFPFAELFSAEKLKKNIDVAKEPVKEPANEAVKDATAEAKEPEAKPAVPESKPSRPVALRLPGYGPERYASVEGPAEGQSTLAWALRLPAQQRYLVYFNIEKYLEDAFLSGAPWLKQMAQGWTPVIPVNPSYDTQYRAWTNAVASHVSLFSILSSKLFSLGGKSEDLLGKIAHDAADIFFSSTLYRLEPSGEIVLLKADPESKRLKSTKELLDSWLADYSAILEDTDAADAPKRVAKEQARSRWLVLMENLSGLVRFNSMKSLSTEHVEFYGNPDKIEDAANSPAMRYVENTYSPTPEMSFTQFYYLYFKNGPLAFRGYNSPILLWKGHYAKSEDAGRSPVRQGFPRLELAWAATGQKSNDLEIFEGWLKAALEKTDIGVQFSKWHWKKPANPYGRPRIWEVYADMSLFVKSPTANYLRDFYKRWDANAEAKPIPKTLPMFFALLDESISEGAIGIPARQNAGITESEMSAYLKELLALFPMRLDDFSSWRKVTEDRNLTKAEDWFLMAKSRLSLVSDVGRNREFSVLVGGTAKAASLWNKKYEPFPGTMHDAEDGTFTYKTKGSFKEWLAPALDKKKMVLWSVFETKDNVPAYKRFVADSLELHDEYEVRARQSALEAGQTPTHDRSYRYGTNYAKYFKEVNSPLHPERLEEIYSILLAEFPKEQPDQLKKRALWVIKRHMDFVALEKMANEGLSEASANKLMEAFVHRVGWKEGIPHLEAKGHLPNASQELAGQVSYLGRNIMYGTLTVGRPEKERDQIDHILAVTKAYYLNEAQAHTYYEELQAISKKTAENLERLCSEPAFEGRITDEKSFVDTKHKILGFRIPLLSGAIDMVWGYQDDKERIMQLRLPLMSGIMKHINDTAPTAAGDEARRMLRMLVIEEEKEMQEQKWWETWVNRGMLAFLVMQGGSKLHPGFGYWLANSAGAQAMNRAVSYALGGYFFYKLSHEAYRDFIEMPARNERFRSVRDTVVLGEIQLVTDEDASLMDEYDRALVDQQWSKWSWFSRGWDLAIASNNFLIPTIKAVINPRGMLYATQRWSAWAWERSYFGKAMKTSFTYQAVVEKQLKAEAEQLAKEGMKFMGFDPKKSIPKEKLEAAINLKLEELIRTKYGGEFVDGHWLPNASMTKLLRRDAKTQIEMAARNAHLDLLTLESTAKPQVGVALSEPAAIAEGGWLKRVSNSLYNKIPEPLRVSAPDSGGFVAFQAQNRTRIETLRQIEAKLASDRPHLTVDDIKLLLGGQGSIYARHTPLLIGFTGVHIPLLNPVALYQVSRLNAALNAGMDIHQGVSFTLLSAWMDRYLVLESAAGEQPLLKLIAEQRNMTTGQLIEAIARGEAFKTLGREEMKVAAEELREIFQLSGMPATPELIRAIGSNERGQILSILKKARFKYITVGQRSLPPAKATQTAALQATEVEVIGEFKWSATEALKNATAAEPIAQFEIYDKEIERQLRGQIVNGKAIDVPLVQKLARTYQAATLEGELGEKYLRVHGTVLRSEAIEVRIAARYRRFIELEQAKYDPSNSNISNRVSRLFSDMTSLHLADLNGLAESEMTAREAMGVLGMRPVRTWTESNLATFEKHLRKLVNTNTDSIAKAKDLMTNLMPSKQAATRTLKSLAEAVGIPVKYLENPAIFERVMSPSITSKAEWLLVDTETEQLKLLFSSKPITSVSDAAIALKMPTSRSNWNADMVKTRTDAFYEELSGLYQGDLAAMEKSTAWQRISNAENELMKHIAGTP